MVSLLKNWPGRFDDGQAACSSI